MPWHWGFCILFSDLTAEVNTKQAFNHEAREGDIQFEIEQEKEADSW